MQGGGQGNTLAPVFLSSQLALCRRFRTHDLRPVGRCKAQNWFPLFACPTHAPRIFLVAYMALNRGLWSIYTFMGCLTGDGIYIAFSFMIVFTWPRFYGSFRPQGWAAMPQYAFVDLGIRPMPFDLDSLREGVFGGG